MQDAANILFVDDEQLLQSLFERVVTRHGMRATGCSNAIQAMDALRAHEYDLVVTDFMMPDMDGLELLAYIREEYPDLPVIMITAHANVQHAVRSMQKGAIDYLAKPFSPTILVERIEAALSRRSEAQAEEPRAARKKPSGGERKKVRFIGEDSSVMRLREMIPKVSRNNAPVFIQGESGTGKEILARLIHEESERGERPFVAVNCANLPRELVESHLFGHRKGAFTGAVEDMIGAFERAEGGTLLLDEITEIALPVQAKLLRVLQEREFQKVGSTELQPVDVRVIATSNRVLADAIADGDFREDLYHRLVVFPLTTVPLRERLSDISILCEHFVEKYSNLYGLPEKTISPTLMKQFMAYSWPGNVRQLENLVQRGAILSAERTSIEPEDVFDSFFFDSDLSQVQGRADAGSVETIEDMERHMILKALSDTGNNQQEAAKRLGISARTIRNKLRKYREEGLIDV